MLPPYIMLIKNKLQRNGFVSGKDATGGHPYCLNFAEYSGMAHGNKTCAERDWWPSGMFTPVDVVLSVVITDLSPF